MNGDSQSLPNYGQIKNLTYLQIIFTLFHSIITYII